MQQRDHRSSDTGAAASLRRRKRLWEVPASAHGLLIGLGSPPAELRRTMDRLFCGESTLDDAALHAAVTAQCAARNKVSEALQRAFDVRHVQMVARFRSAKSADAVRALWQQALAEGQVAAGLWSALTHPCADAALQAGICGDAQLALYGAISAVDAGRRRADALLHENGVLARELARIQQRQTRWHAERQTEQADLAAARLDVIRLQAELATRERAMAAAQSGVGTGTDAAAERRAAAMAERAARPASPAAAPASPRAEVAITSASSIQAPADAALAPGSLIDAIGEARRILCVGGRTGHVPIYRALVEEQGGRFLHHDGGIQDNVRRLDAQLNAADLVICQTGCLSHNAYWRVKDHCKRTGTPCVYLDKPGTGSFMRGLVAGGAAADGAVSGDVAADALDRAAD